MYRLGHTEYLCKTHGKVEHLRLREAALFHILNHIIELRRVPTETIPSVVDRFAVAQLHTPVQEIARSRHGRSRITSLFGVCAFPRYTTHVSM